MASVFTSKISCGVYQLHGLWDPSHLILKKLMGAYKGQANAQGRQYGFAQVLFSDVDLGKGGNGNRFAEYLKKNFPHTELFSLGARSSPSTGNHIRTWIWTIPHGEFVAHKFYRKAEAFDPQRDPEGRAEARDRANARLLASYRDELVANIRESFADIEDSLE